MPAMFCRNRHLIFPGLIFVWPLQNGKIFKLLTYKVIKNSCQSVLSLRDIQIYNHSFLKIYVMIVQSLIGEFEHEVENTRKLLKAIPDSALQYKPSDISWSTGQLPRILLKCITGLHQPLTRMLWTWPPINMIKATLVKRKISLPNLKKM